MKPTTYAVLALFGVGALSLTLFWLQNSSRTTQLSFDMGFTAVISDPIQIPLLMLICVAGGAALAGVPLLLSARRAKTRARRLEHDLAFSGDGGSDDGWK